MKQNICPTHFPSDVLDANDRTYEQRLSACRLISPSEPNVPTVLGMLVIGKSPKDWLPGTYIQFIRFQGNALDAPIADELQISGVLSEIFAQD